jgi:geranylgeranyl pyrophosphate synthase
MTNDFSLSPRLLPILEARLEDFLREHSRSGAAFNAQMSRYHLSTGGKRLRALIPCWVYESCGAPCEQAILLGCALEMVHNATLVHDDLQDGDVLRRGQPTVWKNWSPAQAINCGDAMFEFAVELLTEIDLDPARLLRVIRRVTRGVLQVIEGQAQEFVMKDEPYPTLERYLGVIRGKTAALVATSVGSALLALGQDEAVILAAEDAAMRAGTLFQLQDDLLDIYGDKGRDRAGSDIAEGKVSALIALLNERASPADRERVRVILRKPREATADDEIKLVLELLEKSGAKEGAIAHLTRIQAELENHELASLAPGVHRVIVQLAEVFLKPVESMTRPHA